MRLCQLAAFCDNNGSNFFWLAPRRVTFVQQSIDKKKLAGCEAFLYA